MSLCKAAPNFVLDFWTEPSPLQPRVTRGQSDVAIATRTFELHEADEDLNNTDQKLDACRRELRLVVPFASIDSDQDGVPDSVARRAGIRVVMITGDSPKLWPLPATSPSASLRITCSIPLLIVRLRPDGNSLSNEQMSALVEHASFHTRQDKLEIVKSLQHAVLQNLSPSSCWCTSLRSSTVGVIHPLLHEVMTLLQRPTFELREAGEDLNTDQKFDACRRELRLVVLIASIDPDRDGVPDLVTTARRAGRVACFTGDYSGSLWPLPTTSSFSSLRITSCTPLLIARACVRTETPRRTGS